MAIKNSEGIIIGRPAGKHDKIDVTCLSQTQILEIVLGKEIKKTKVRNKEEIKGVRSDDLDLGVTIKAYDNATRTQRQGVER